MLRPTPVAIVTEPAVQLVKQRERAKVQTVITSHENSLQQVLLGHN